MEQKTSSFIRKWLNLHHSTTNICFYSSSSPCPLPIKSLTSIFKSCKISGLLLLRDSRDPLVSGNKPNLKSGSWNANGAVRSAESEINFRKLRGPTQFGRAGIGTTPRKSIPNDKHSHEYRKLISETSKEIDEESQLARALQLQVQCQWTRWDNYVKNDLSWTFVLDTPPNLLSFCLASTYDVLPSPSNLKRWRICAEASCFLCGKEVCTTSHVLGACQISLSQGRFTFRHDSVLKCLVDALNTFIKELPKLPVKRVNKVSFVKAGSCKTRTKSKPTGILHLSNDWKMVADLSDSYMFPCHIAVSALRPDIVIYSNTSKRVIIVELTCPCEENMESWHSTKLLKYSGLASVISSNGWYCDLFTIEVGARGYCSRSVTTCLKRLGFCNNLAFASAKKFGEISMRASFCIWVARNSKVWSPDIDLIETTHPPVKARKKGKEKGTSDSLKKSTPPHSEPPKSPARTEPPKSNQASTYHAGFINKGNTCYANSILQVLSVIPALWSQLPSESSHLSPLVKSISLNMSLIKRSSSPIDPSNFLRALERSISLSHGTAFDFNSQHDVPEMLHVVLDELKGMSPRADSLIATTTQTSITCDTCFCSSVKERKDDMLLLPTSKHVSSSFTKLLQTESLSGDNKWFCPQCSSYQISTKETSIISCGQILIVHLSRYLDSGNNVFIKNTDFVECLPETTHVLRVPIQTGDSISFTNQYSLIATINHSGTLQAGHYWAFIKDRSTNNWLKCNDRAVLKVKPHTLNNNTSYVLFYIRN